MSCPICEKRKPKRFCPAKGEKICAVCCGTEREVTIDCPSDCPYLLAARRYELEHRKPIESSEAPYPDARVSMDLVRERSAVISGLGHAILQFAAENKSLNDAEASAALGALAETHRTLATGIYFERPPDAPVSRALYEHLVIFLQEFKKQEAEHAGFSNLKDSEVFYLLVFLLRVGRHETNGRPRSRAFLDFLRAQFPKAIEAEKEAPRIVMP